MVIGGQAVLLYGEPRLTRDIDITLGVDTGCLDEILDLAGELSLRALPDDVKEFALQTMVLPCLHEKTGIRVDFIFSFTPYETQAIQRANKIEILETEVCFASPEDVISTKSLQAGHATGKMPDQSCFAAITWISHTYGPGLMNLICLRKKKDFGKASRN